LKEGGEGRTEGEVLNQKRLWPKARGEGGKQKKTNFRDSNDAVWGLKKGKELERKGGGQPQKKEIKKDSEDNAWLLKVKYFAGGSLIRRSGLTQRTSKKRHSGPWFIGKRGG